MTTAKRRIDADPCCWMSHEIKSNGGEKKQQNTVEVVLSHSLEVTLSHAGVHQEGQTNFRPRLQDPTTATSDDTYDAHVPSSNA